MSEVNGIFVVAHELKTPLSLMRQLSLSMEIPTLERLPAEILDNYSSDDIKILVSELKTLKKTKEQLISVADLAIKQVNDLTKIARLEDNQFELEPVSVRRVCDEVTEELKYLYRANHRELSRKYSNHKPLAYANREMLKSVVYNFASNAMHYSGDGTKSYLFVRDRKFAVAPEDSAPIMASLERPASFEHPPKLVENFLEIEVRDFGPALPLKIWQDLKKGWIDAPTDIAMRPGSSGLGLYIASKFSKAMGGSVSATRHRDGTSFKINLPVTYQGSLL